MLDPASIRFNNPGAMWGGTALARKWGATGNIALNDGLGQNNHIAVFPDKVHGAAAQFDLWHSSPYYHDKQLSAAIHTWSGGNSWEGYVSFLCARVQGLTASTMINDYFLKSPQGLAMMKAQAWNEAGRPYPMTDGEWEQAQAMVFGLQGRPPAPAPGPAEATPTAAHPMLRAGDTGHSVSELQTDLGCRVTGSFLERSETEYALRLFQVRNDLTPDGICGDRTWAKIIASVHKS